MLKFAVFCLLVASVAAQGYSQYLYSTNVGTRPAAIARPATIATTQVFAPQPQFTNTQVFAPKPVPVAQQYTAPAQVFTPPRSEYSAPAQVFTPPRSEYSAPAQVFTPPRSEYSAPATQVFESNPVPVSQQYSAPAQVFTPPRSEYAYAAPPATTQIFSVSRPEENTIFNKVPIIHNAAKCSIGEVQRIYQEEQVDENYCRCPSGTYGYTCLEYFVNPCNDNLQQYFNADASIGPNYFIQCSWNIPYLMKCPAQLVWNQAILTCDWPITSNLGSRHDPNTIIATSSVNGYATGAYNSPHQTPIATSVFTSPPTYNKPNYYPY